MAMTIRLASINAPEITGEQKPDGLNAKAHLEMLVEKHCDEQGRLLLRTRKDRKEKYGRYLGTLLSPDGSTNINALMVSDGFAKPFMAEI
jgi:endonuclease YncB( thermonuclease family)